MRRYLCPAEDIAEGQMTSVDGAGLPELVVYNVEGTYYVTAATCSHGQVPLVEGRIIGCEVECPLHSGRFDIATGQATRRPAKRPIDVFGCVVIDGDLFLEPLELTGEVTIGRAATA